MERHFSWVQRVPHYIASVCVTALMLGVAAAAMVVSLNCQGYIHSEVRASAPERQPLSLPPAGVR
jgi:hypothetical protein